MGMQGGGVGSDRLRALAERSIDIILSNQAPSGGYVASPNFPVYQYSWLRDGAFIAEAMNRADQHRSAEGFLDWCRRIIEARTERIAGLVTRRRAGEPVKKKEYLHTRYTLDGEEGDDEWWNHQLDGYGAWLWALGAHRSLSRIDESRFSAAVEATGTYLMAFWNTPCYDTWEENGDQIHVATLAAIRAGLRVVAEWPGVSEHTRMSAHEVTEHIEAVVREKGTRNGHLVKWLEGEDLDANLLFCAIPFGLFTADDPLMKSTVSELTTHLVDGGVHRHLADTFYGGGEWLLLTAVLGSYEAAIGDQEGAQARLEWVAAQANRDGWLPEQVNKNLLHPSRFAEWEKRWGPVASPLLWSHAMYLNLYQDIHVGE